MREGVIRGSPLIIIRSTGSAGARSIFAKVSLPSESKNAFLADLPPGSPEGTTGKSVGGFRRGDASPPYEEKNSPPQAADWQKRGRAKP